MRHAFLSGAVWSAYAARRGASTSDDGRDRTLLPVIGICPRPAAQALPEGVGASVTGELAPRPMTVADLSLANAYDDRSWASPE